MTITAAAVVIMSATLALELAAISAEPKANCSQEEAPKAATRWAVSHKPVAVAAGLGVMGFHHCVIHPRFGDFVLLGTILVAEEVNECSKPLGENPCVNCHLCVSACPTGAIGADGKFNPSACHTHNYHEFSGGFTDWVEQLADSRDAADYRRRFSPAETAHMWQSLAHGGVYRCVYCLAVCPAGGEVIGTYQRDQQKHVREIVTPLRQKEEMIFVLPGSDAQQHVARHFPNKTAKIVGSGR